jgi:outer membrane protein TolC
MRRFTIIGLAPCVPAARRRRKSHLLAVPLAGCLPRSVQRMGRRQPKARLPPQAWWTVFEDPELDALERQLLRNSPDLASALARYQQAHAATDTLRAAQSPALSANAGMQRSGQREGRPQRAPGTGTEINSAAIGLELGYEIDLWGRVRQQVRAGLAQERAAQADLAAARLALQAQLADTLIALRARTPSSLCCARP